MLVYAINLLLIVTWPFVLYKRSGYVKEKVYCCIVAVQLMIISAFRSLSVGQDLPGYNEWFNRIRSTPIQQMYQLKYVSGYEGMETGWNWLNKFLSIVYPNFRIVIIFTSFVFVGGICWFILKYSKIKWLSFYLFITLGYYTQSFSALRQYLAIVILLYGFKYVERRKLVKFIVVVCIASFIHKSALVFLPVYWLPKIKAKGLYWPVIGFCSVVLLMYAPNILRFVIERTKYRGYLKYLGQGSGDGMLVMFLGFVFLILVYIRKYRRSDGNADLYLSLFMIAVLLNIASLSLGLIGRIMLYFHISLIILLPNLLATVKNRQSRYMGLLAVCSLTFIYYFIFLLKADMQGVVPYVFM